MDSAQGTRGKPQPDPRPVDLATLDELAEEVDRIVIGAERGKAQATGEWSIGQILEHLAKMIESSLDGFPFRARWWNRLAIRLRERPMNQMPGGGFEQLPGAAGLRPHDAVTISAGAARFRAALARLHRGEQMQAAHPVLGRMPHDAWVDFHLRYAELQLGRCRMLNDE